MRLIETGQLMLSVEISPSQRTQMIKSLALWQKQRQLLKCVVFTLRLSEMSKNMHEFKQFKLIPVTEERKMDY
jgi:hypothetical protein